MASSRTPTRCLCGADETYARCCGALHRGLRSGEAVAPTAERLMRSRYSAFAVGNAAYLMATWHPSTRPASLDLPADVQWQGLEVLGAEAGSEHDDAGTVEFVASYWDATSHERGQQHEHSTFVREDGRWLYLGPTEEHGRRGAR